MSYTEKKYNRINWKNRPSTATALGATNLNHMDSFLNEVDNALIQMDAEKLGVETANSMLKSVEYDKSTGTWTFKQLDGTVFTYDQNIEKIPVSFTLSEDGVLTMTTEDGTEWTCNVAELIKEYVFDDSDTIGFTKELKENGYHVKAIVKEGSIESKHLNPDYRSDIQNYMNTAQTSANDALNYSKDSKRWAVGDSSYVGSDTDNSKYYKELAEKAKEDAEKARDEAQASTGTKVMTSSALGVGRPDNSTISVDENGIFGLIAKAIDIFAVDTSGLVGDAGESSNIQALIDVLSETSIAVNKMNHVSEVSLLVSAWEGESAPYSQTVSLDDATEDTDAMLVSALADDASLETQKAYNKAFSIISSGSATIGDGIVTFNVYEKPDTDIVVGLKGV